MKTKKQQYRALQYASLVQRWRWLPKNIIFDIVTKSEVNERMLNRNRIEADGKRI